MTTHEVFIEVDPRLQPLLDRMQDSAALVRAGARAMDQENQITVGLIQRDRLNFPRTGPTSPIGCRVITGRLRGSLRASRTTISGDSLVSSIGSNVRYAAALEEGFEGEVQVGAHARKQFSMQRVFGRRKKLRGADSQVRAHTRRVSILARHFVRDTLAAQLPHYRDNIAAAMLGWVEGGKK